MLGKSATQSVVFAGPLLTVKPTAPPPATVVVGTVTVGGGGPVTVTSSLVASRVNPFAANQRTLYVPGVRGTGSDTVALAIPLAGGDLVPFR